MIREFSSIMVIPNPAAVIALSVAFGAAFSVNVIGAEAYLISIADPVYALYGGVAAGIGYWAFLTFFNPRRIKFATAAIVLVGIYILFLASLATPLYSGVFRAVCWFFLALFAHRFFRWVVAQLVIRHLDPARAQAHLSYLVATYDLGMLVVLVGMKAFGVVLDPGQVIFATIALCLVGIVFIAAQFVPAENFEIRFSHKTADPPAVVGKGFDSLVTTFCLMALCFGAFVMCEQYLVRIVLKRSLGSYAEIQRVVTGYKMIGSFGIAVVGIALAVLLKRNRISPIAVLKVDFVLLAAVGLVCAATGSFHAFILFEIFRWVGENCLWFLSTQMVVASFVDRYRVKLSLGQNLFFYPLAGIPLIALFALSNWDSGLATERMLLGGTVLLLGGSFFLVRRLDKLLSASLYGFAATGHKTAGILAVNMLSFLRPPGYESELRRLLELSPKKLLRKNIILCLGYGEEHKSLDTVIHEFESDQEEIQIAVLDALRISKKYKAVQFLVKVVRAEARPRTIRVRISAARAVAAMYGRHSIPFLLNGLDDQDSRVVANTLETLAEFNDHDLIPYFENFVESSIPRVKANALMGLAGGRTTRGRFRETASTILRGDDRHMIASVLYVIGRLRDRRFLPQIVKIVSDDALMGDPSVERCAAWALIRLRDKRGYEFFARFLVNRPATDGCPLEGFMHFFSQVSRENRMDLIKHAVLSSRKDPEAMGNLEEALQRRTFDFHEELDYFYLLKNRR